MRKQYPQLNSVHEIRHELTERGIDVFEPKSMPQKHAAQLFEEFSHFVFHSEKDECLKILEHDLDNGGGSVGELQGGSDTYAIYRVSFPSDDSDGQTDNAALQLVNYYNQHHGLSSKSSLSTEKIKQYMIGMCDRRTRERNCRNYTSLGNLMFIMQFGGPTEGQVRHIDNMVPNLQICLYMSSNCPSTTVYAMDEGDGLPVISARTLVDFWERQNENIVVPHLLRDILIQHADSKLKSKKHTKYFGWTTINLQLLCFGKLYQPVEYQLGLHVKPGTTLLAGGNDIHAGPPAKESRMFAFAIGIPEEDIEDQKENASVDGDGTNDGEVQYSPVLFHIDFCCLLFSILDHENNQADNNEGSAGEAKHFLVDILIDLIKDYPMDEYLLQIDQEREDVRNWLKSILSRLKEGRVVDDLVQNAVQSDRILYSPDLIMRRAKKKKHLSKYNKMKK